MVVHITDFQLLSSYNYWLYHLRTRTGKSSCTAARVMEALVRSLLTGPALLELLQVACENVSLESFLEGRVPREPECWPVCLFTCFTISKSFLVHTDWCPGTVRTVGTSVFSRETTSWETCAHCFCLLKAQQISQCCKGVCVEGWSCVPLYFFFKKRNNCGIRKQKITGIIENKIKNPSSYKISLGETYISWGLEIL